MAETKHLLIVYHSRSGTTSKIAEAIIKGASHADIENVEVRVRDALTASVDDLIRTNGLILGTPEIVGYTSGALKYFLDRVYYPREHKLAGMPYALFVRAGNDGTGAISGVTRILTGF
jgi:multimeric flavodoxin WrbA